MNVGTLLSSLETLKRTYTYPDAAKEESRRQRSHHDSRKSYMSHMSHSHMCDLNEHAED